MSTSRLLASLGAALAIALPLSAQSTTVVPIVLDVRAGTAHYTTELSLANPGAVAADVTLRYTASLGDKLGSGSMTERIPAGAQIRYPNVISALRDGRLPIPETGSHGGVLVVESSKGPIVATARTTTAVDSPEGRAGLAYGGLGPADGLTGTATVYGLRSGRIDRSNLAVFSTSGEPVTLRVTAFDGESGRSAVVDAALSLPAWGWHQFDRVLDTVGYATGWATVERTSAGGSFSTYGVVNDNATSDGSFIPPVVPSAGETGPITLPVLVETGEFLSELVVANRGTTTARLSLSYVESLSPAGGPGGTVWLDVAAGRQEIIPDAIEFLRSLGISIGPKGTASYAGALRITVSRVEPHEVFIGARTAAQSPEGGQFGLFTPCVYPGQEATTEARIYGLAADAENRTNVAVLHAGPDETGPITLRLQVLDGDTGSDLAGPPLEVTLEPGQWAQPVGFFAAAGVENGIVRITRLEGSAPWVAYGVVNDGGAPRQRTGDGAYVPAVPGPAPIAPTGE